MGDGVSASLSGPQLEEGDGGGREKEMEGWRVIKKAESRAFVSYLSLLRLFTCDEMLSLLVFSLTLARAPFSPDDFSVTSRAALSSLGVSDLTGAAGT